MDTICISGSTIQSISVDARTEATRNEESLKACRSCTGM